MKRVYLGIDPGVGGGIALIDEFGAWIQAGAMPEDETGVWEYISLIGANYHEPVTCLEKVGGFIGTRPGGGEHRNMASGHTMFTFGASYGGLRMALVAAGLMARTIHITPRKWQGELGITPKTLGENQSSFKNRIKSKAVELFPTAKVTLKVADALLLAEYARRADGGKV